MKKGGKHVQEVWASFIGGSTGFGDGHPGLGSKCRKHIKEGEFVSFPKD
jgi:hypothetical protein